MPNVLSCESGSKFDTNAATKVGDNRLSFWKLCIGQIEASTSPPPPPGIPRAFDTFAVPGRRECDYQSPPGGGEIDPHALGGKAGIWTAPSSSYEVSGVASHHGGRGVRGFLRKRLCLCGQLVTRNGLKQALCRIWRHFCFKIFNTGFRLWIYECISCVYNEIQYLYRRFNTTIQNKEK